ncbi:hypothetical protein Scep_008938 [Stephania cephalantha]|uniref:COBRA C-terminal domain-containing protein n=1 Tax=Stephania cephalantha TaxID=152367 RepID=A0AAP0JSC5_9MAGN
MNFNNLLIFSVIFASLQISISQPPPPPPPASDVCNGVYLSYTFNSGQRLPPRTENPSQQPYKFQSTATILNNGLEDLKSWKLFVGFQHDELLVSASNAVLADGTSLPAQVGNGSGAVFAGFPATDLKTAVETAGDLAQMQVQIGLVGTQFGVGSPDVPMPSNISLVNDGFLCKNLVLQGKSQMSACCVKDAKFKAVIVADKFLPRQSGDLTIDYDVLRSYDTEYYAQVKIANHNPLGRLDGWKLSWDWMRDEFIYTMKGAYPSVVDSTDCIYGRQGAYYKVFDFSNVLSCEKRPTIVDLPLTMANDSNLGLIPFCCRNGTILSPFMDPSKSVSVFQLQVKKMPPDLNRTQLFPPQNWKINGTLNPDYECGPPIRVRPSEFPDPSGLPSKTAVASWQVVCNITQHKGSSPRCCVSFSAFYNDSVVPCKTCACGCPRNPSQTCSASADALLLPSDALLVPFDNRTAKALSWAEIKHRPVPKPLPCADNCGVSINWHVYTDYRNGWSARITLFNWGETSFSDWFAAVQFGKAAAGFEQMYSFNGSALPGNDSTIFMQGLPGLNYLVAEQNAGDPTRDPPVPGKQQSVISFTKKNTPKLDVAAGDGFPTKVFFNGEECSLPSVFPTSNGYRTSGASLTWAALVATIVILLMQQQLW